MVISSGEKLLSWIGDKKLSRAEKNSLMVFYSVYEPYKQERLALGWRCMFLVCDSGEPTVTILQWRGAMVSSYKFLIAGTEGSYQDKAFLAKKLREKCEKALFKDNTKTINLGEK